MFRFFFIYTALDSIALCQIVPSRIAIRSGTISVCLFCFVKRIQQTKTKTGYFVVVVVGCCFEYCFRDVDQRLLLQFLIGVFAHRFDDSFRHRRSCRSCCFAQRRHCIRDAGSERFVDFVDRNVVDCLCYLSSKTWYN